jgi:hypothetical protein
VQTVHWASTAFGILLVSLVGAAALLLAAGNGTSVAVGLVIGLLVGLLLAVATGLFFIGARGGISWSSRRPAASRDPDAGALREMREMAELSSLDLGEVRAVQSVLATSEAGGLNLQLVSLERCEAGLRASIDVRQRPGAGHPGPFAEMAASDDAGTTYRAAVQGGGGQTPARFIVVIVPAPPPAATELRLEISRFFEPFERRRSQDGPWRFEVKLG